MRAKARAAETEADAARLLPQVGLDVHEVLVLGADVHRQLPALGPVELVVAALVGRLRFARPTTSNAHAGCDLTRGVRKPDGSEVAYVC
eukprot:6212588-Pleurochrysis_carterae.AAC.2